MRVIHRVGAGLAGLAVVGGAIAGLGAAYRATDHALNPKDDTRQLGVSYGGKNQCTYENWMKGWGKEADRSGIAVVAAHSEKPPAVNGARCTGQVAQDTKENTYVEAYYSKVARPDVGSDGWVG